ncbi:MAG: hypothetical protein LH468_12380 [Nocardioides sp.]|nr:hypothetical protein [Nocardioides sp.]
MSEPTPHPRTPAAGTPERGRLLTFVLLVGVGVCLLLGLPLTVLGLIGVRDAGGQLMLCLGLVLLVAVAGGVGRELAERSHDRHPPSPRLDHWDGEPALHLPRSAGRSRVSSWTLTGIAAVCGLGAVLALGGGRVPGGVALLVLAGLLLLTAAPWSAGAGGVWFTPTRVAHVQDGTRWEVAWDDVTGSWKGEPVPVMLRPGARPRIRRTPAAGRKRGRTRDGDTMLIESRYLAGGAVLASYVVLNAVGDRAFRAALGSPASLPPG